MSTETKENETFSVIKKKFGFVPNLLRELGETAPAVLNVYLGGQEALVQSSLNARELNVAMLAISSVNGCDYCKAAHSTLLKGAGLGREDIDAVAEGENLSDKRLDSIARATRLIADMNGFLTPEDLAGLKKQGLGKTQIYEIIAVIGLKTISNYVNHINHTTIDPQFSA